MTANLHRSTAVIESLPDPPQRTDMRQSHHYVSAGAILRAHFAGRDDVLVAGGGYVIESVEGVDDWGRQLDPECVVAFGVNPDAIIARNGYVVAEVGKPPEFILDISAWTSKPGDEARGQEVYSAMGVSEYWRFDGSGKGYYPQPLTGYRLVGGSYRPIQLTEEPDGEVRGYSAALSLFLCRLPEDILRFAKPAGGQYLPTLSELREREAQALAERDQERAGRRRERAERDRERAARIKSERRNAELEAEIARLRERLDSS